MFRRITRSATATSLGVSPLWATWRSAADDVWAAWEALSRAPRTGRHAAYEQYLATLITEARAAAALEAR